jgi:hypothetical protein
VLTKKLKMISLLCNCFKTFEWNLKVIGFGIDESLGVSNQLKFANLPVVSTKDCFDAFKVEPKEFSYCAGYTNGKRD